MATGSPRVPRSPGGATTAVPISLEHISPATRLLEKRKEMSQVQEALDAQKSEFAQKEAAFKAREENLRKKDLELQEALVVFNKFLKENEAKRRRADRKASEEIKQKEQKQQEIKARTHRLKQITSKFGQLRREVARNEQFQIFLKRVQSENLVEYPDIESILTRYYCLMDAHRDLMKKQTDLTEQLEAKRNEFILFTKDQHKANLILNNDIARHSKDLEEAVKRHVALEEQLESMRKAEIARTLKISQIIMAVENLFQRCRKSSTILNHTKTVEHQLQMLSISGGGAGAGGQSQPSTGAVSATVSSSQPSNPSSPRQVASPRSASADQKLPPLPLPSSPNKSADPPRPRSPNTARSASALGSPSSPTSAAGAEKPAPSNCSDSAENLSKQTDIRLDVVANYFVDFRDIVEKYA